MQSVFSINEFEFKSKVNKYVTLGCQCHRPLYEYDGNQAEKRTLQKPALRRSVSSLMQNFNDPSPACIL